MTPSQIGVALRDQHGIPQVRFITGKKILRILKKQGRPFSKAGCAPELPEDLYMLIKKAVSMRKHLKRSKSDISCKFNLIIVESRIHRLSRYYKKTGQISPNWK